MKVWRGMVLAGLLPLMLALTGAASGAPTTGGAATPPSDTCVIPFVTCYIVLSNESGSPGNSETVTGAQFYPGEPFTVYLWNGTPGAPATTVATGLTGTGSFSVTFPIPADPAGSHVIFVTDLAGDNQSAPFQLTHLRARPDSSPVASLTSLRGQGFLPDHGLKFSIDGVPASVSGRCRTNPQGSFSNCRVRIPNVPMGPLPLIATDGTYAAQIEFDVN